MDTSASVIATFKSSTGSSGFVLDFDGTLSEIVVDPSAAVPVDGVHAILERLAAKYRTVAVVTGRRADQVQNLLALEGVRYFGLYGAEEIVDGKLAQSPSSQLWRSMASRLARDAEALITTESLRGCQVEFKDVAVSIHHRQSQVASARDAILTWAETAAPRRGFQVTLGRMVVELRPVGVSKSSALERVVTEHALRNLLVAGDDSSDVEAMIRAKELPSVEVFNVGIASEEEPEGLQKVSDLMVPSVSAFVSLLDRF